MTTTHLAQPGRFVQFHIRDVHLPDPSTILRELYEGRTLVGRVIDVSDAGPGRTFAVIEVEHLHQNVVVAVERLEPV